MALVTERKTSILHKFPLTFDYSIEFTKLPVLHYIVQYSTVLQELLRELLRVQVPVRLFQYYY